MLKLKELENIEGIEFIPINEISFDEGDAAVETIRAGKEVTIVDILAKQFKEELTQLGIDFLRDEDNETFIPLRKYYATALRYTLENHNPETDKKYMTLKNEVGLGYHIHYYESIVVPQLADKVYDLFFIDHTHPMLYNFKDGIDDYSITSMSHGEYGFMKWENRIAEAITPSKKDNGVTLDMVSKAFDESGLSDMFKDTWANIYTDRISTIFSATAQAQIRKSDESMSRMSDLTDGLDLD